jgi:hypothetical protein
MRLVVRIFGSILIAMGVIWILQGVNILPGSFMTGQMVWAWRGAAAAAVGVALLLIARKRR